MANVVATNATRAWQLASFCSDFASTALPAGFARKARDHITDTLACGIAGACSIEGQSVLAMLESLGEHGSAPVWGTSVGLSARSAAFCNGVATHSFELDDTMGCDHSGAVVIPAAVAALGLTDRPVTGQEFITAVVLGYEVAKRVMEALGGYWPLNNAGWHSTAACGAFGAAIAASRILRLSPDQTASAMGHAASFSGGLWAFIHDASQTKRIHAGRAAEGGLTAALLAQAGVSGPNHVFEDVWGSYLKAFAPNGHDADRLLLGLGEHWEFGLAAIKPYASCRGTHSSLDAIRALVRQHAIAESELAALTIMLPRGLHDMCGGRDTTNLASAQMSLPYAVAAFLEHGELGISEFSAERRDSPAIRERMQQVQLHADETLPSLAEPTVTIHCRSGATHTMCVPSPLGNPDNPLSEAQLHRKASDLLSMALDAAAAAHLLRGLSDLQTWEDLRDLPALLATDGRPPLFR